jgi:hypothetical protein
MDACLVSLYSYTSQASMVTALSGDLGTASPGR